MTYNGSAAAGIPLALRFYNGTSWSALATTSTASDGSFVFSGMPSLSPGQRYYVLFLNTTNPAFLLVWQTARLTSYTTGTMVPIGDFDIADIPLGPPGQNSAVSLPYTFDWTRRSADQSDSYEFNLFNPSGPEWWWTPKLGYVGSYTLNSLPTGFKPNTYYRWYVAVYSPLGGYGESFNDYQVVFGNTGIPGAAGLRTSQPPKEFLENAQPRSMQR